MDSGPGPKNPLQCVFHVFSGVLAFIGVDKIVRLNQNLIVQAVDALEGVMMAHQPGDPVHGVLREASICQEAPDQGGAFLLLILSISVSVFLPAEGTGDIVDDGGNLQNCLRRAVQSLALAYGFGEGVDLHKMVDVMPVSIGVLYHHTGNIRLRQ